MKIAELTLGQWAFIAIGFLILWIAYPVVATSLVAGIVIGALLSHRNSTTGTTASQISPIAETTRLEKRTSVVTEIRVPVLTKMCAYCKSVIEGPVTKCPNCGAALT